MPRRLYWQNMLVRQGFAWNWALARCIEQFESSKDKDRLTNAAVQHREWNTWKRENAPWWIEISKCAPQESLRDLDKAFKVFWAGRKNGHCCGFPRFKKKGCGRGGVMPTFERHSLSLPYWPLYPRQASDSSP